jgi:hypothetical protein
MINNQEHITLDVVNRQLEAYNRHDYEVFAACYYKDIVSFDLNTSEKIEEMSGSNFFEHYFNKFLKNPQIHCLVQERIINGNLVVDKEQISNFQGGSHNELVIYQVNDGLISQMWFRR